LVCTDYKDLGPDILFRRIYDFEGGSWENTSEGAWEKTAFNYHLAISCNHCDNPACVENCPTGAMQKDAETGLVNSNPEVCIGCGTCQNSCPYDAPRIDAELSISR
ncbi:4Fe-4S dicluster domain-containing protein, partial [Adlercreutzia rubneri]|uniref:4Fe-4S dicluster domain-containing protein n=1 Tax=Adlercreutzia rubneri TaxID=2916441 RepID=UPI0023B05295